MKYKFWLIPFLVMGITLAFSVGCQKEADGDGFINYVPDSVIDLEGNIYHTVTIGKQVWMVENLKVSRYRNGDPIPIVYDNSAWSNLTSGAYCNFEHDEINSSEYGRLYNWYAITDQRNIAPEGWHIPDEEEWGTLIALLANDKSTSGNNSWSAIAIRISGQVGYRADSGTFDHSFGLRTWWSSTESDVNNAWSTTEGFDNQIRRDNKNKNYGLYLRCIRD